MPYLTRARQGLLVLLLGAAALTMTACGHTYTTHHVVVHHVHHVVVHHVYVHHHY